MIARKIRVDLSKYDSDWGGSYMLVVTQAFHKTMEIVKIIRMLNRKLHKIDKKIEKLEKFLEKNDDVIKEKEKEALENQQVTTTEEILDKMINFIAVRFVGGFIYDTELKKLRELKKEDIGEFDREIIHDLYDKISGGLEKKT